MLHLSTHTPVSTYFVWRVLSFSTQMARKTKVTSSTKTVLNVYQYNLNHHSRNLKLLFSFKNSALLSLGLPAGSLPPMPSCQFSSLHLQTLFFSKIPTRTITMHSVLFFHALSFQIKSKNTGGKKKKERKITRKWQKALLAKVHLGRARWASVHPLFPRLFTSLDLAFFIYTLPVVEIPGFSHLL